MIMVIMSVCLMTAPQQCQEVTLPVMADGASPYMCMTMGQIEASKWANEHPGWMLKNLRCGPARPSAEAP